MRILLLGKNGQIGWELQRALPSPGELVALGRGELDLADGGAIADAVRDIKPDVMVNAAAYTAVDRAEEEPEQAMAVNGVAPGILAEEAARLGAVLIHYSTDYIFDGEKGAPYREEDSPNPLSSYGRTKLAGEEAIRAAGGSYLIFRTSWVYGLRGKNFLLTILRQAREKEELRVVDDQVGTPNECGTLARATARVLAAYLRSGNKDLAGIYNLSASGETSWFGFAREILAADPRREEQLCREIIPIDTGSFPTPARRPRYSVLDNNKVQNTFGIKFGSWKSDLKELLQQASITD